MQSNKTINNRQMMKEASPECSIKETGQVTYQNVRFIWQTVKKFLCLTEYVLSQLLHADGYTAGEIQDFSLYVFMHCATQMISVNDVMTCDLPDQLCRTTPTSAVVQIL